MSDAVEIRSGGAVAVDPRSLDDAAGLLESVAILLADAAAEVRRAVALLDLAGSRSAVGPHVADAVVEAGDTARRLATGLRAAAVVYELVEARAERAAAAASGDSAAIGRIDARIATLGGARRGVGLLAGREEAEWADGWDDEFLAQTAGAALFLGPTGVLVASLFAQAAVGAIRVAGGGRVARGSVLGGAAAAPSMEATARASVRPPARLSDLAARIPSSPARVRVERYELSGRTRRFAVYVAGTQAWAGEDPWDMPSNLRLYTGARSDSYAATAAALEEAGALPGDVVYAVGHSQGAMIASRLAVEGGYDTRALVTFGSPVEADVDPSTLSVQVRHRDDPVSLLAGSGAAAPVGAEGGFIAERTVDERGSVADLALGAHRLEAYTETARLVDASGDPRAAHLAEVLAELSSVEGESVEWAPRVSRPASAGRGRRPS